MSDLKSNGARRRPVHFVRSGERQQPGAVFDPAADAAPGTRNGGPKRLAAIERPPVTLPEIPSLARDPGFTCEDGSFSHAMRLAVEAMAEGPLPERHRMTLEEDGALTRAFGLPERGGSVEVRSAVPRRDATS